MNAGESTGKLALGSAQFGMNYGINNARGRVPEKEVFEILSYALSGGVDCLDTAGAYGTSEDVIGSFPGTPKFKIVSKLAACSPNDVDELVDGSLRRLRSTALYGYLVHDFRNFESEPGIWERLATLKASGEIAKAGFSLYFPREVESLFRRGIIPDILQLPLSVFDQRFVPYLPEMRSRGIELHVRSVFLQGLIFVPAEKLEHEFPEMAGPVRAATELAREKGCSLLELALNFAARQPSVDRVVVGVDGVSNLKEILRAMEAPHTGNAGLERLAVNNDKLVVPSNWKKKGRS